MKNSNHTSLNIHIAHLMLEGISLTRYQQAQLKESLEKELRVMFETGEIPASFSSDQAKISAPAIRLNNTNPGTEDLGKQIAASIYNGLSASKQKLNDDRDSSN